MRLHVSTMMQVQVWQICLFDCLISQGYKSDPIVTFIRKEIAFTKVLFAQLQNVQNLYKGTHQMKYEKINDVIRDAVKNYLADFFR